MRTISWKALRTAGSLIHIQPCRVVAGSRHSTPQHNFHSSPRRRREDDSSDAPRNPATGPPPEVARPIAFPHVQEAVWGPPEDGPESPAKPKDRSNYGSAARRAGRNIKRVKELPPVHIPSWFLDRNVKLQQSFSRRSQKAAILHGRSTNPTSSENPSLSSAESSSSWEEIQSQGENSSGSTGDSGAGKDINAGDSPGSTDRPDAVNEGIKPESGANLAVDCAQDLGGGVRIGAHHIERESLRELYSLVSAGLQIPSGERGEVVTSPKPHVVLLCPKNGAGNILEAVVRSLAVDMETDYVRLTPLDIAEIGGDYLDDPSDFRLNTLSSLGYDASLTTLAKNQSAQQDPAEEEDDDDEAEEEETEQLGLKGTPFSHAANGGFPRAVHIGTFRLGSLQDMLKPLLSPSGSSQTPNPNGLKPPQSQVVDITPELKMGRFVETLLNTPEIKRAAGRATTGTATPDQTLRATEDTDHQFEIAATNLPDAPSLEADEHQPHGLIVLIQDYPQINSTANGSKFLDKLHEVVNARRQDGQKVVIIGTASSKELISSFSRSSINDIQSEPSDGPARTMIFPVKNLPANRTFDLEHKRKIQRTNLRHLRDMLRRMAPDSAQVASIVMDWNLEINSKITFLSGLDESIWPMDRVNRAATIAVGLLGDREEMTTKHLERALELIELSDDAKTSWLADEKQHRTKEQDSASESADQDSKERMRKLRKTCNDHEKKLLNGVVNPENIRTTFADVQAPGATIDALKTLTSLSLVRPDAFTYGVLATDRIPGLLLYGPPGTGKTLLAKAVAKESGATVLEVSGSDVYDMYVGEGEKNVKAIFTLAKKLSPCVVFIDEADAILGARSGGSNRTSHRELINQFLREWDGMTDTSAFIMVATNRPFDLDEASLRRLPRRLLVDLPVEKDREAILKIHLKDEKLDPEVSVAQIAAETPFYSGSDLKNVAVAAALACVREEFETAASHNADSTKEDKYQYPEKRTLQPRHFKKALEEISASISDDMGSLSAIRKFDEKYGDRRGRRKKSDYGFKTVPDGEKAGSEYARVRNQT